MEECKEHGGVFCPNMRSVQICLDSVFYRSNRSPQSLRKLGTFKGLARVSNVSGGPISAGHLAM